MCHCTHQGPQESAVRSFLTTPARPHALPLLRSTPRSFCVRGIRRVVRDDQLQNQQPKRPRVSAHAGVSGRACARRAGPTRTARDVLCSVPPCMRLATKRTCDTTFSMPISAGSWLSSSAACTASRQACEKAGACSCRLHSAQALLLLRGVPHPPPPTRSQQRMPQLPCPCLPAPYLPHFICSQVLEGLEHKPVVACRQDPHDCEERDLFAAGSSGVGHRRAGGQAHHSSSGLNAAHLALQGCIELRLCPG